jgi:hypothetical protein
MGWPPGHYYSPLPSIEEIKKNEEKIFFVPSEIPGINLFPDEQIKLFNNFKIFYPEIPFTPTKENNLRYYYHNPNFSYGEVIILFCMIKFLKPRRIIEIGAGYTSCAILDINELFFNNKIDTIFIEPYPELFLSLLQKDSQNNYKLITERVQDLNKDIFTTLQSNDILFIDSSHVSKVNSDINYLFFEILPKLNNGVYIHFHDIYYPFEYPKEWIYKGIAWNEVYLLRSFLQFNSYLSNFYKELFIKDMPLFLKNPGSSIWIKKEL